MSSDLLSICNQKLPDFIFISEPWLFQSDLPLATEIFLPRYFCSLNSNDKIDPELALTARIAHGGVLVFWKKYLDPYISTINVDSSRFLIFVFNHPNYPKTIHVSVYLPTAGLENEFIEEISKLEASLDHLAAEHPDATVFIRGDANASLTPRPGNKRDTLFRYFCEKLSLTSSNIPHPTYHHFRGNTSSSIDVILQTSSSLNQEVISNVLCSKKNPQVDSKHDIILSTFCLPYTPSSQQTTPSSAPRIQNTKHKVIWNDDGVQPYRDLLSPTLVSLQKNWNSPQSSVSFSVLLQCTNEALISAAKATNKVVDLTTEPKVKNTFLPPEVSSAAKEKLAAHKNWLKVSEDPTSSEVSIAEAKLNFTSSRTSYRRIWRRHLSRKANDQSSEVHTILSTDPSKAFRKLKALKSTASAKICEV